MSDELAAALAAVQQALETQPTPAAPARPRMKTVILQRVERDASGRIKHISKVEHVVPIDTDPDTLAQP